MVEYLVRMSLNYPGSGEPTPEPLEVHVSAESPEEAMRAAQNSFDGFKVLSVYLKVWSWYELGDSETETP